MVTTGVPVGKSLVGLSLIVLRVTNYWRAILFRYGMGSTNSVPMTIS